MDLPSPDDRPPPDPVDATRRTALLRAAALLAAPLAACAVPALRDQRLIWERRLKGDAVVLLGEVHDNAEHHRLRLAALRRAIDRGWRPAIAMEQFDADRQSAIERARSERPADAAHLVAQAGRDGWDWRFYRPLVALALEHDLPLIAANLPRETASRLVRAGYAEVLGAERAAALGLAEPIPEAWLAAQEKALDEGHCGALPTHALAGTARAQFARDALMAERLAGHADRGAVLIAGNGHVRRDIAVPRWLWRVHRLAPERLMVVGFVEDGEAPGYRDAFDATVVTPPVERPDPCEAFRARRPASSSTR